MTQPQLGEILEIIHRLIELNWGLNWDVDSEWNQQISILEESVGHGPCTASLYGILLSIFFESFHLGIEHFKVLPENFIQNI